jgi:hypothetical protein
VSHYDSLDEFTHIGFIGDIDIVAFEMETVTCG